jgi:hypothetical protein
MVRGGTITIGATDNNGNNELGIRAVKAEIQRAELGKARDAMNVKGFAL